MSISAEQNVIGQMEAVNLTGLAAAELVVDGKIHRFKPAWEKKQKRGWYVLFDFVTDKGERLISGSFGWFQGAENYSYDVSLHSGAVPNLSEDERQRMAVEQAAKKALSEKEFIAAKKAAAKKASSLFASLPDAGACAYLDRKKVRAYGVRFSRGSIIVPVKDMDGVIHGLQFIQADGTKKFLTDTDKKGHFHLIGIVGDDTPILFAEGYATAASLYQATKYPVVVAFDAGNLSPVAEIGRAHV
jgi:putative DNA primase/helicase